MITHKAHKAQTCNLIVDMNCLSLTGMHLVWVHRIFLNRTKIFTVMRFAEPIVCLFAISNMYVYLLFAKIILLDTINSLKFL